MHLAETRREPTYTDVGNADIAGANICHPWWLNTRIRPLRTVEVQVLQEQKPAMRVMVVDRCPRFMSLTINGTAVKKVINTIDFMGAYNYTEELLEINLDQCIL